MLSNFMSKKYILTEAINKYKSEIIFFHVRIMSDIAL